ncbi:MAG: hypothetical protein QXP42_00900 [Candidatus Micrarchaeia archaeon]
MKLKPSLFVFVFLALLALIMVSKMLGGKEKAEASMKAPEVEEIMTPNLGKSTEQIEENNTPPTPPPQAEVPPRQFTMPNISDSELAEKNKNRITTMPLIIFANLPEFPEDFYATQGMVADGLIDISELNESYWKQPEFIPTWKTQGEALFRNPPKGRWGAYGLGVYPNKITVRLRKGQNATTSFLLHSGYLVQSYQGVALSYQNSSGIVLNLLPNPVLLEPTAPIFEYGWVEKINLTIVINVSAQAGMHEIPIWITAPDNETSKIWASTHSPYTTSAMNMWSGPLVKVLVDVLE